MVIRDIILQIVVQEEMTPISQQQQQQKNTPHNCSHSLKDAHTSSTCNAFNVRVGILYVVRILPFSYTDLCPFLLIVYSFS